jgi:hypothetical protein
MTGHSMTSVADHVSSRINDAIRALAAASFGSRMDASAPQPRSICCTR